MGWLCNNLPKCAFCIASPPPDGHAISSQRRRQEANRASPATASGPPREINLSARPCDKEFLHFSSSGRWSPHRRCFPLRQNRGNAARIIRMAEEALRNAELHLETLPELRTPSAAQQRLVGHHQTSWASVGELTRRLNRPASAFRCDLLSALWQRGGGDDEKT